MPLETIEMPAAVETPAASTPEVTPQATPQATPPSAPKSDAPQKSWIDGIVDKMDAPETEEVEIKEEAKPEDKKGEKVEAKKDAPDEDDAALRAMTPKAQAKWKEIRAEKKAAEARATESETKSKSYETQLAERDAKVKELEGKTAQLGDIDRLKEQVDRYEKELYIARVEATPEYERTVLEPMSKVIGHVDRMAAKYNVPKSKIIDALKEADIDKQVEALDAFATEFHERDRNILYNLGDDYQKITARQTDLRANSAQALKEIQEREQAEASEMSAAQQQEWNRAAAQTWDKLSAHFKDLPEEEVTKLKGAVAGIDWSKENAEGKAFAAYSATLLPKMVTANREQATKIKELETRVANLTKAKPNGSSAKEVEETKKPNNMSLVDSIMAGMGR